MRHAITIALCCVPFAIPGAALDNTQKLPKYDALLARVKGGDVSIDYSALRHAFAKTRHYNPFGSGSADQTKKMYRALEAEEHKKALKAAKTILADAFINGEAHLVAAISHGELGNEDRSVFHSAIARGLAESICAGTDGRSPDAPCRVISTDEEYFYMLSAGLEHLRRALMDCKSGPCDRWTVRDEQSGETFALYFDVSTQMQIIEDALGGE